MIQKTAKAPEHLRPPTRAWFESVLNSYALEEHHVKLLTLAAEAWDRGQEAREVLAKTGLTYNDRFEVPRVRPEVAIERDSRVGFARLLRELALDVEEPNSRPPKINGNASARRG